MYNAAEKFLLNHIFDSIIYLGVSASQSRLCCKCQLMTCKTLEPSWIKKIPTGTDLVLEVLETRWNRRNTEMFDTKMYGKTYGDKVC